LLDSAERKESTGVESRSCGDRLISAEGQRGVFLNRRRGSREDELFPVAGGGEEKK